MLQGCELQVNKDDDFYPKDVTHVYAQNHFCDEWNNKRITSLQGDTYECVAFDSKKDHCTELTMIDISLKPQKTGNLRKVLHVKVGARVILTTNIDVSDGLTNGAVGTEIAVDMKPAKGHYTVGQAYVAFNRVTQLDKLHIINYTRHKFMFHNMQKRRWRGYTKIPYHQCQNVFST